eukprot:1368687-Prymnesium_polylepis.1
MEPSSRMGPYWNPHSSRLTCVFSVEAPCFKYEDTRRRVWSDQIGESHDCFRHVLFVNATSMQHQPEQPALD